MDAVDSLIQAAKELKWKGQQRPHEIREFIEDAFDRRQRQRQAAAAEELRQTLAPDYEKQMQEASKAALASDSRAVSDGQAALAKIGQKFDKLMASNLKQLEQELIAERRRFEQELGKVV